MLQVFKAGQGVFLPQLRIGLDYCGLNTDYVFISHAHADHIPAQKNAQFIATRPTSRFLKSRNFKKPVHELSFSQSFETDSAKVTFYPAGHILGSAMTFIESDYGNLLYTGDFRSPASPASEGFGLPESEIDIFITEATFSLPLYRWEPHTSIKQQLLDFTEQAFNDGFNPVFQAYSLGKTQEILHLMADSHFSFCIPDSAFELTNIYKDEGIPLAEYHSLSEELKPNEAVICPAAIVSGEMAATFSKIRTAWCSGWAAVKNSRFSSAADVQIPISDHADFFELVEICKQIRPKHTYLTHTPNPSVLIHFLEKDNLKTSYLDDYKWTAD